MWIIYKTVGFQKNVTQLVEIIVTSETIQNTSILPKYQLKCFLGMISHSELINHDSLGWVIG